MINISEATQQYLDCLNHINCPYLLFSHYVVLLSLNIYGGTYSIKPSLTKICRQLSLYEDGNGERKKIEERALSFPITGLKNKVKEINEMVKQWITAVVPYNDTQTIFFVNHGHKQAIQYLKSICDFVFYSSSISNSEREEKSNTTNNTVRINRIALQLECPCKLWKI